MGKATRPSHLRCGHKQVLSKKDYDAFFDRKGGVTVRCSECETDQKVTSVPADDAMQTSFNNLLGF